MTAQGRKLQIIDFSKKCCLNATRYRKQVVVRSPTYACRESFGPPARRLELPRRWLQVFFNLAAFFVSVIRVDVAASGPIHLQEPTRGARGGLVAYGPTVDI